MYFNVIILLYFLRSFYEAEDKGDSPVARNAQNSMVFRQPVVPRGVRRARADIVVHRDGDCVLRAHRRGGRVHRRILARFQAAFNSRVYGGVCGKLETHAAAALLV